MSHNRNPKPPYPDEFRQQMVELVKAGRKPTELAKEFGCHETSITKWVRQAGGLPMPAQAAPVGPYCKLLPRWSTFIFEFVHGKAGT